MLLLNVFPVLDHQNIRHLSQYHLKVAIEALQNFEGTVVVTSTNVWTVRFHTRFAIVHRRLHQQNYNYPNRHKVLILQLYEIPQ